MPKHNRAETRISWFQHKILQGQTGSGETCDGVHLIPTTGGVYCTNCQSLIVEDASKLGSEYAYLKERKGK